MEDDNEVIEVNDNKVIEVEEDLRDLLVLWYDLTFKVILRREEKGVLNRRFQGTALAFTDARLFAIQKVPGSEFVVLRTKVSAHYANLAPKSWFVTDIEINSDFEDVL